MKHIKTIERQILKHESLIKKIRADKSLNPKKKKRGIFILQSLIRQLKWVLN